MITKANFLEKFRLLFDSTDTEEIQLNTFFKDVEEWNSLVILSLIVMCEEEYNAIVTPIQINESKTIEDLYNSIFNDHNAA